MRLVRDAMRGVPVDYTTAPIGRAIVMLAVPMVMEMLMESIFVVADVFWVARLGANAVATVGLTESLMTIIYTLAMGLSVGAMAIVARRIGEQDPEAPRARRGSVDRCSGSPLPRRSAWLVRRSPRSCWR